MTHRSPARPCGAADRRGSELWRASTSTGCSAPSQLARPAHARRDGGWTRRVLARARGARSRRPGPRARHPVALVPHGAGRGHDRGGRNARGASQAPDEQRPGGRAITSTHSRSQRRRDRLRPRRPRTGRRVRTGLLAARDRAPNLLAAGAAGRPSLSVADALLTYLQIGEGGGLTLHQRFVELDRGTARPAEQLASKITRYTRLRHYAGAAGFSRFACKATLAQLLPLVPAPADRVRRPVSRPDTEPDTSHARPA